MDYSNFMHNLKTIRTCEGMSAKDLAIKCELKQHKRILDIEEGRGKPSIDEVASICKELECSIDEMLYKRVEVDYNWK